MDLRRYIIDAAASPRVVPPEVVSCACAELGISATDFCDHFAKEVARAYLAEELSWLDADTAMNSLSGYFFGLPKEIPFPDYAFGVFLAFDAGEVLEAPENERVTKEQLVALHAKG